MNIQSVNKFIRKNLKKVRLTKGRSKKGGLKPQHLKTRKFKKIKCSPYQKKNIDEELQKFTCYSRDNLQVFKNIWNADNDDKITTNNSKEIWMFFKNKLNKKCYDELCWLKDTKLSKIHNSELLVKEIFKPLTVDAAIFQ